MPVRHLYARPTRSPSRMPLPASLRQASTSHPSYHLVFVHSFWGQNNLAITMPQLCNPPSHFDFSDIWLILIVLQL